MPTFTAGASGVDFDSVDLTALAQAQVTGAGASGFSIVSGSATFTVSGSGFTYGGGLPLGGTITEVDETSGGVTAFTYSGLSVNVADINQALATGDDDLAKAVLFGGPNVENGSSARDLLRGFAGDDTINGNDGDDLINAGGGNNSVAGGNGDDVIVTTSGSNYLRGGDGDDHIIGGSGFDDINGNKGADTIDGGSGGNDWLVGGQGDDFITAHASHNLLYGNLGNDTLNGGSDGDTLRGGQGDDLIIGGAGNDYISGDRGNDTETGGAGADLFHTSQDAGVDKVLDFHISEGDQVLLDPGTTYTVSQVGADTVIDLGNGNEMILVGVQMSTLTGNWIIGA